MKRTMFRLSVALLMKLSGFSFNVSDEDVY